MDRAISDPVWKAILAALAQHCGATGRSPGEVLTEWWPSLEDFFNKKSGAPTEGARLVCNASGMYLSTAGK